MDVEFIASTPQGPVVKMRDRRFPGLVVQGDTLFSLLQDLEEEAPESYAIRTVEAWLEAYEAALAELGIETPYPPRHRRPED